MATKWGPEIVTDGLVLALDSANERSYPGDETTCNRGVDKINNNRII